MREIRQKKHRNGRSLKIFRSSNRRSMTKHYKFDPLDQFILRVFIEMSIKRVLTDSIVYRTR
jgi:hypothetical protein